MYASLSSRCYVYNRMRIGYTNNVIILTPPVKVTQSLKTSHNPSKSTNFIHVRKKNVAQNARSQTIAPAPITREHFTTLTALKRGSMSSWHVTHSAIGYSRRDTMASGDRNSGKFRRHLCSAIGCGRTRGLPAVGPSSPERDVVSWCLCPCSAWTWADWLVRRRMSARSIPTLTWTLTPFV